LFKRRRFPVEIILLCVRWLRIPGMVIGGSTRS
jgi:hypothetical protein